MSRNQLTDKAIYVSLMFLWCFVLPLGATEYHVSKRGSDANSGTKESPFLTISEAASHAMPGDVVIVHEGVYREEISPERGGESDSKRIVFRAADNEKVVIKGSEIVRGWTRVKGDVWKVELPNSYFGDFNPFATLVCGDWFNGKGRDHHAGCVYVNDEALFEAARLEDLYRKSLKTGLKPLNSWHAEVGETTTVIHAQFPGIDPNLETVEISKRETVFYPRRPFVNYITVSGFEMKHASPRWAPPTAEQMGLIGTHWSKGWIIENNRISHSVNVGISLGKYGDEHDNLAPTAEAYLASIDRAFRNGWNRDSVGSHIVRNNEISYCEQAGICGSMGASFSRIVGNHVHHIHTQKRFSGAEMAGIKFHAPIDVLISGNRIDHTPLGLWLDWMTQGTRVSCNLLYANHKDFFVEVNHGPAVFDNNIFASSSADNRSQGMAFVNNLFLGEYCCWLDLERATPYFVPHTTVKIADHRIDIGDASFYNNIFVGNGTCGPTKNAEKQMKSWRQRDHVIFRAFGLWVYDEMPEAPKTGGNIYLNGARPYEKEKALTVDSNPGIAIIESGDRVYLKIDVLPEMISEKGRKVTTKTLGTARVPDAEFEDYDGSFLVVGRDYFGMSRRKNRVVSGPFEHLAEGENLIRVW